jgi:hypothetical protein
MRIFKLKIFMGLYSSSPRSTRKSSRGRWSREKRMRRGGEEGRTGKQGRMEIDKGGTCYGRGRKGRMGRKREGGEEKRVSNFLHDSRYSLVKSLSLTSPKTYGISPKL